MKKIAFISLLIVLGIAPSCAQGDASDGGAAPGMVEQSEMVSDTIVSVAEDGTESVTVRWLTRAARRAQNQARAALLAAKGAPGAHEENVGETAAALVEDASCSQLWLNDEPDQGGNRICFYKVGTSQNDYVYLGNYCLMRDYFTNRCRFTWEGSVQSYCSWTDPGYFFTPCPYIQWFPSYDQENTVNSCVAQATHVGLGSLIH
jgi:hypothetical protein